MNRFTFSNETLARRHRWTKEEEDKVHEWLESLGPEEFDEAMRVFNLAFFNASHKKETWLENKEKKEKLMANHIAEEDIVLPMPAPTTKRSLWKKYKQHKYLARRKMWHVINWVLGKISQRAYDFSQYIDRVQKKHKKPGTFKLLNPYLGDKEVAQPWPPTTARRDVEEMERIFDANMDAYKTIADEVEVDGKPALYPQETMDAVQMGKKSE